jgi:hypothetical protein
MTSPKPRRTQSRPLAPEGRAQTVQTSLSPPQAAWVASRGVPVAAYLRGLVEAEMSRADGREVAVACRHLPRCESCAATEDVHFAPCPYASDIHGDYTNVWLCDACRDQRAGDV